MSIKKTKLIILLGFFLTEQLVSQNSPVLLSGLKSYIGFGISANPILNASIDYGHQMPKLKIKNNPVSLLTQFSAPLFTKKGFDYDLTVGLGSVIEMKKHFKVLTSMSIPFSRTSDLNATYYNVAFKVDLYPGYCTDRWMIASHLSWQYVPNVHIKNKDYAKESFEDLYTQGTPGRYNKPQDGWFWQNGHILRAGVSLCYVQQKWNINLTGGFQYAYNKLGIVMFPDIGLMPFYGWLNFAHAL